VQFIFNTPSGRGARTDEGKIRSAAVAYGVTCVTTVPGCIAVVKALEAIKDDPVPRVRALQDWMEKQASKILPKRIRCEFARDPMLQKKQSFYKLFQSKRSPSMILAINPLQLNPRLSIQQGIFLCPTTITKTFWDNLGPLLETGSSSNHFIKLIIEDDKKLRSTILRNLHRMNINEATLYPGIDGYSRSLGYRLVNWKILLRESNLC
jgi:hypothetical protein